MLKESMDTMTEVVVAPACTGSSCKDTAGLQKERPNESRCIRPAAPSLPLTVTIPPLACSQPLRVHPSYAHIQKQADRWLLAVVNPSGKEEAERLVQSLFPFLACAAHVELEEGLCEVVARLTAWAFSFDDIYDDMKEGLGCAHSAADKFQNELDQALLGQQAVASKDGTAGVALHDISERHRNAASIDVGLAWWNEIRAHLSPDYQLRFRHSVQRYSAAATTQVAWRQARIIPDLYTYIVTRRYTALLEPFFVILEAGLGVKFDSSLLDCPLLNLLRTAAIDHVSWVNDMMSFKSEYVLNGDYCNIVAIVWLQPSSPGHGNLQKSVDIVSHMIQQRDKDFAGLLEEVHNSTTLMEKPGVAKYVRGIADWLSGNLHWSYATARYYNDVDLGSPRLVNRPLTIHLSAA